MQQQGSDSNGNKAARPAPRGGSDPARRIARLVRRARLALAAERAWPPLALLLAVAALFAGLSWMGLWTAVGPLVRVALLALFGAGLAVPLLALARLHLPGRAEAIARIEADSQRPHRPLTAFGDAPASTDDPVTRALWAAHRARVAAEIATLRVAPPAPKLYRRDPFALRTLAGLVLFVGVFAGAGDYAGRLGDAFAPLGPPPAAQAARLDAWIAPPAYTGRAPVFLTGEAGREGPRTVRVPAGSELIVRLQGVADATVSLTDTRGTRAIGEKAGGPAGEHRTTLAESGAVRVSRGGTAMAEWTFTADRDAAPAVRWTADPVADKTGALVLAYGIGDDYGVTAARAEIAPVTKPGDPAPRPLAAAPDVPLVLPPRPATTGEARTAANLTRHPFAGARVRIVLVVRDEAGQEGRSEPREIVLPERAFRSPLARAIVEQRRNLALDAGSQTAVIDALDALMIAPDGIFDRPADYLGTRIAYHHLVAAQDDAALKPLLDEFWQLALAIDEGSAGDAAAALRAAQERLRDAIRNGAPPEEVARLTDELRKAMQAYLSALAEQAGRRGPSSQPPPAGNARTVTPQDLERMLKEIERLSKAGQQEAAEQLLAQLQAMLEGMQMAGPGQGGPGDSSRGQLDALGRMIQNQQKLLDDTYRLDRGEGAPGGEPGTPPAGEGNATPGPGGREDSGGSEGRNGGQDTGGGNRQATPAPAPGEGAGSGPGAPKNLDDIRRRQGELQQELDRLTGELGRLPGAGEGETPEGGRNALDKAGKAMGEAGEALGRSDTAGALERQTEALESLRRGAHDIAEQMAEALARQNGTQSGSGQGGRAAGNQDPLGRERGQAGPDFGNSVRVPDEIDVQRARRILDELRRRLGEPGRPRDELDYLERLLPGN